MFHFNYFIYTYIENITLVDKIKKNSLIFIPNELFDYKNIFLYLGISAGT